MRVAPRIRQTRDWVRQNTTRPKLPDLLALAEFLRCTGSFGGQKLPGRAAAARRRFHFCSFAMNNNVPSDRTQHW